MEYKSLLESTGSVRRTKNISRRVQDITVSAIKEMAIIAGKEKDTISLSWGLPTFSTPPHIREAVKNALDQEENIGKYSQPPHGIQALREAIAHNYAVEKGIKIDPNTQIIVTAGAMEALVCAMHTVADVGDEIIITNPGFSSHIEQMRLFGIKPVFWNLNEEKDWGLDIQMLESLISPKTKAILLVNPSNPTGSVFSKEVLLKVAEIVKKHNLVVICDEPYDFLVFDEKKHYSIAQIEELKDNIVFIGSLSKRYAMTGWRIGYIVSEAGLINQMMKVHDATVICASTVSQFAAIAALTGSQDCVKEFQDELSKCRDLFYSRLTELDKIFSFKKTSGSYYVFPRIICKHTNSYDFALKILNEAKVVIVPGDAFGSLGKDHVRMTFCGTKAEINTAFDRLFEWQKNNCDS
jgi:aminotransferase